MHYTVYSENTGEILRVVSKPDEDGLPKLKSGEAFLQGSIDSKRYNVISETVIPKPKNSAKIDKAKMAVGEYAKITGLNNPSWIYLKGNDEGFFYTVTDGEFEFSIDTEGSYSVECTSNIDLPRTFEIEVI